HTTNPAHDGVSMNTYPPDRHNQRISAVVYRITDSDHIDFTIHPQVFEFMGTEFSMSDFMVAQNLPEDVTQSLADAGYNDGYMPRGAGNSDTAVYAVSLKDFHSLGELNIALLEW